MTSFEPDTSRAVACKSRAVLQTRALAWGEGKGVYGIYTEYEASGNGTAPSEPYWPEPNPSSADVQC